MADKDETVSQEAFDRIKHDLEKVTKERDDLAGKVTELGTTVKDLHVVGAARSALKGKVADPDTAADMLAPHLRDVEPDKIADHISSDDFKPRLAAFQPAETPTPGDGSGDGPGGEPAGGAAEPGAEGFGGPSPGGASDAKPVDGKETVKVGTPEYFELLSKPDAYETAVKENRIVDAAPTYR